MAFQLLQGCWTSIHRVEVAPDARQVLGGVQTLSTAVRPSKTAHVMPNAIDVVLMLILASCFCGSFKYLQHSTARAPEAVAPR